ncbi:uncharacterized protein A4U43_C07F8410 [Asparagus officinalis]|uniref:Helicase-associated domain-containing protein n=1 Tax=Asparagus officinalis TaxID=4686 RepID=A0A5P1EAG9_ASPOF|nr:uncharacterized protein A4U43_C07F8410 [Asparagus officinalis]
MIKPSICPRILLHKITFSIPCISALWVLVALNNVGSLTELGWKMVEFPLGPLLAKMLLMGEQLERPNEALTMVSMLSVPSVFFRPKDRVEESDTAREKLFVSESDHLTLLNVYQWWKSNHTPLSLLFRNPTTPLTTPHLFFRSGPPQPQKAVSTPSAYPHSITSSIVEAQQRSNQPQAETPSTLRDTAHVHPCPQTPSRRNPVRTPTSRHALAIPAVRLHTPLSTPTRRQIQCSPPLSSLRLRARPPSAPPWRLLADAEITLRPSPRLTQHDHPRALPRLLHHRPDSPPQQPLSRLLRLPQHRPRSDDPIFFVFHPSPEPTSWERSLGYFKRNYFEKIIYFG